MFVKIFIEKIFANQVTDSKYLADVDVSVPVGHLAAALQLALGELAIILVQRSKEEQSVARKLSFVEHALESSIGHQTHSMNM